MSKKYELTEETKTINSREEDVTLYRIRALIDFGAVKKGDLGGYIEKEENLSHFNNAWVGENAIVFENARVFGHAWVSGYARVFGNAWVSGKANVSGDTKVFGDAIVSGYARVFGDAIVSGNTVVRGSTRLSTDANVESNSDYIVIGPIGSRDDYTTIYRTKTTDSVRIQCGCFNGTPDEFFTKVRETHPESSMYYKQYTTLVNATINILSEKEDYQRESIDKNIEPRR